MALTDILNALEWPAAGTLGVSTSTQLVVRVVLFLLFALVAKSLYNGLSIRLKFRKLQSQGFVSGYSFASRQWRVREC